MSRLLRRLAAATDVALSRQVDRLKRLAAKAHADYERASTPEEATRALERYERCQQALGRIRFGGLS